MARTPQDPAGHEGGPPATGSDQRTRASTGATPPKVIGLGTPISVWIYFEVSEIPALLDAIGDELARRGCSAQINGRTVEPKAGVDPAAWRYQIDELQRMLGDVEGATSKYSHRRFDVLWPTVMAHGVVHGALAHAERRAADAAARDVAAARAALAAAEQSRRDFDAVDTGGLLDVWL